MRVIDSALKALGKVREQTDSILVGVSGKDSMVVLDLCCQVFPRVEAYTMRLLDIRMATYDAEVAARRHKVKLHIVPHWEAMAAVKNAILRWHRDDVTAMPNVKLRDVENGVRQASGIEWIATGERMVDSSIRRFRFKKTQGVLEDSKHVAPIYEWLDRDVVGYLRVKRIPLPERWGTKNLAMGSGFGLNEACILYLKEHYPKDYERVREAFPFCEIFEKRRQFQAAQGAEVPGEEAAP